MFGITAISRKKIIDFFCNYHEIEQVLIFGSRAKGNYKNGSDIDFAIKSKNSSAILAFDIKSKLNEQLSIPYFCDVVDYSLLQNQALKNHIDQLGKLFFSNNKII